MTPEDLEKRRQFVEGITQILSENLECKVMVLIHGTSTGFQILENFINDAPSEFGMLDLARLFIAQNIQNRLAMMHTVENSRDVREGLDAMSQVGFDKKKVN